MTEVAGLVMDASWRALAPALAAALILILARRSRPSRRCSPRTAHAVWAVMLAGMLLLPLLVAAGPRWPVAMPAIPFAGPVSAEAPKGPSPVSSKGASVPAARPVTAEPERGRPGIRWGAVYGAGLAVLLCRFLYGLWLARRVRRGGLVLVHPRLEALARELLPGRAVAFCSSSAVRVPFTMGLLRPRVFLPPDWEAWRDDALRGAVGHELCHVRRRDYAWAVLAELNRCLYWFHPLAWFLPRRLSQLADQVSDELGASAVRSVTGYARLLVEMAERITIRPGRLAPAAIILPVVGTHGLATRVEALLSRPSRGRRLQRPWAGAFAGVTLIGVVLLSAAVEVGAGSSPRFAPSASPTEPVAALASADPETRAAAALELARRSETDAIPHLLLLLGDGAPIAAPPSGFAYRAGWMPARNVLHHASPGEVATIALASFGSRSARPLASALASADPVVRRNAAWGLGEIRQPRGIPEDGLAAVVRALRDPDASVRAAAAWAAGDIRIASAVPDLAWLLRHETSWRTRAKAADALGEIRDPAALDDLEAARGRERNLAVLWAISGALKEFD